MAQNAQKILKNPKMKIIKAVKTSKYTTELNNNIKKQMKK